MTDADRQASDIAASLLRRAADLVDLARKRLNVASQPCGCCGTRRFDNFGHAKVFEQVGRTSDTLHQAAFRLVDEAKADKRNETGGHSAARNATREP